MSSKSAVRAIGCSRNRRSKPTKILIGSGAVIRLMLTEFPLIIDAALDTRRFFPGFCAHETR